MKKNGLFTFVTACVPGFGQMYYGYMRRGVSLAAWFFGISVLAVITGLGFIGFVLPVIWAYAFFDTYNIRNLTAEQRAMFRDEYLPGGDLKLQSMFDKLFKGGRGSRLLGIVLIVAGGLIVYNLFISQFFWRLRELFPFLAYFINSIPALLIAGALIFIGLRVMRGAKHDAPPTDEYDYYYTQQQYPAAQQPEQAAPQADVPQADVPVPEVDKNVVLEVQPGADALAADAPRAEAETDVQAEADDAAARDAKEEQKEAGAKKAKSKKAKGEGEDNG